MARSMFLKFNVLKVQLLLGCINLERATVGQNYNEKSYIKYKIIVFHEHIKDPKLLGNEIF